MTWYPERTANTQDVAGFARIGRGGTRSGFGVRERKQPMRYCGYCGASFDPALLVGRTCPSCGAPINQTGDITFLNAMDVSGEPTQQPQSGADALSLSSHPTLPEHGYTDTRTHIAPSRRIARKLPTLLALVALAALLVGGSALLLNNATGGAVQLPLMPAGGGGPQSTATSSALQAVSTNDAQSGPLASPTGSPLAGTPGSGTPTVTPDATVTATVTPVPGQPALTVAPTSFSGLLCLVVPRTAQFTVTNSGDGVMTWSATASQQGYKISPQSGSLGNGQQQSVTVSSISASGSVTITAPGAANSPQTVSINCTL